MTRERERRLETFGRVSKLDDFAVPQQSNFTIHMRPLFLSHWILFVRLDRRTTAVAPHVVRISVFDVNWMYLRWLIPPLSNFPWWLLSAIRHYSDSVIFIIYVEWLAVGFGACGLWTTVSEAEEWIKWNAITKDIITKLATFINRLNYFYYSSIPLITYDLVFVQLTIAWKARNPCGEHLHSVLLFIIN